MEKAIITVIKRNGKNVSFDRHRIFIAIEKAFLSDNISSPLIIEQLTNEVELAIKNTMLDNSLGSIREKFSIKGAEDETRISIILPK